MYSFLLLSALLLDAFFGEPDWAWSRFPHPVILMGKLIRLADDRFNRGKCRTANGVYVTAGLTIASLAFGKLVAMIPDMGLLELLGAAILISYRSLIDHVKSVAEGLQTDLSHGRCHVAKIVGRDVEQMEEEDIIRAAIESAAENFSDGVVAPAFWFLVFGLPGILTYKVINTADSMIGHRNERYGEFGLAAARLDDIVNWIPARLSCLLIVITNGAWRKFREIADDAGQHRSPNAGWLEVAVAAAMNISLSGPRRYDGVLCDYPYINERGRKTLFARDIHVALSVLRKAWTGLCAICLFLIILTL